MEAKFANTKPLLISLVLTSISLLTACGGGGGGGKGGNTPPPPTSYSVSANAGQGGSVSPSNRTVNSGQTASFTLTPNTGYRLSGATGCNGRLEGNVYTTGAITTDCAVTVSFVAETSYTINTRATSGGNISPVSASVASGANTNFTITPNTGYRLASITGCNGTLEDNRFTITTVNADCTIEATFEVQQFTINTEVIGPGALFPSSAKVNYGESVLFYQAKIVPGHDMELLPGCDARWEIGAGGAIRVPPVTDNCTVRVRYIPFNYEITTSVTGDGVITPTKVNAKYGDELRFTIQPGTGKRFSYSKGCDGYFESNDSVFIIPSVTESCQLNVSFNDQRYVYFADPNLEQKVREALNINAEQPILPSEMEKLTHLNAEHLRITQLDGLEYAKNLKELSIQYNQISSLRPLENLALTSLFASGNPITDKQLVFLSNSPLLTSLVMDSTKLTDLTSLANHTQLSYLSIQYTQVTDLTPLERLQKLEILQAMYTSIADISPLLSPGLGKLENVSLGGCLIDEGFSRALPVANALTNKGVHVVLVEPMAWQEQKCPFTQKIKNVLLSGRLDSGELELNWQVISDDPGPWRCEVHLNLDNQLPRLPVHVIENCHTRNNIRLPGFNLNEYSPSLRVDTGIYKERLTSAPAVIISPQKPQTASLHSYDWAQTLLKTNPLLVPGKEASLRLHVTTQIPSPVPLVELYASLDGKREAVPVTPPASLPAKKHQGERNQSFFSQIPARLMQPGLTLDIFLEGNKQLTLSPAFSNVRGIYLKLIPLQVGEQISSLPSDTVVRNSLTRYWPLGDIQITRRAPYQLSSSGEKVTVPAMLNALNDLQVVENGTSFYYGYFDSNFRKGFLFDGLGNQPGRAAVGINNQVNVDGIDGVLAHELGHNFNRPHAPCNLSEFDLEYPYQGGAIGSYGADVGYTKIFSPELKDLMGYCGFEHVSDHNYEKAQDYLEKQAGMPQLITTPLVRTDKPSQKSTVPSNPAGSSSLYLRIGINAEGAHIAQQIALPHLPILSPGGRHIAMVKFADGSQQRLPVTELHLGHGGEANDYQVQFAIPTDQQQPIGFTLMEHQKVLLQHTFNATTTYLNTTFGRRTKARDAAMQSQLLYRNNEICIDLGATTYRHVNLLWHSDEGVTALALNETAKQFCRSLSNIPAGDPDLQVF